MKKLAVYPSIFILSFFLLQGCDREDENYPIPDSLIGCWINAAYNNDTITYKKSNTLKHNEPGFEFKADQTFIERKNAGD